MKSFRALVILALLLSAGAVFGGLQKTLFAWGYFPRAAPGMANIVVEDFGIYLLTMAVCCVSAAVVLLVAAAVAAAQRRSSNALSTLGLCAAASAIAVRAWTLRRAWLAFAEYRSWRLDQADEIAAVANNVAAARVAGLAAIFFFVVGFAFSVFGRRQRDLLVALCFAAGGALFAAEALTAHLVDDRIVRGFLTTDPETRKVAVALQSGVDSDGSRFPVFRSPADVVGAVQHSNGVLDVRAPPATLQAIVNLSKSDGVFILGAVAPAKAAPIVGDVLLMALMAPPAFRSVRVDHCAAAVAGDPTEPQPPDAVFHARAGHAWRVAWRSGVAHVDVPTEGQAPPPPEAARGCLVIDGDTTAESWLKALAQLHRIRTPTRIQ